MKWFPYVAGKMFELSQVYFGEIEEASTSTMRLFLNVGTIKRRYE